VVTVAAPGCENYPSSSTRRARWICDRGSRDDRDAVARPPVASGAHSGLRGATVSGKNRLRIVAAAKAASPPDDLNHHPQRGVLRPRPRIHPPPSNHRIRRCPSPLRTSWYPQGRVWGRRSPCRSFRALRPCRVAFPLFDDILRGTPWSARRTTGCHDGWIVGVSDFWWVPHDRHRNSATRHSSILTRLQVLTIARHAELSWKRSLSWPE